MIEKLNDLSIYQSNFLKIVSKKGELERFSPNTYQQELNQWTKDRTTPLRILALKCRQIGVSTWASSFIYHRTATQFNKTSLIIADDDENSGGIFNMVKGYYENSPEWVRPMRRYSNQKALVFNDPNDENGERGLNSKVQVTTAGKMSAGRSKTIQYLHCSEYAFWPDAATVSTGLFQSVPYLPNTAIIIESTANGVSGKGAQFYEMCMRALGGDLSYKFFFFDWTENPEYEINPGHDFELTDEERDLMALYPRLTIPKIAFRRYKIKNELGSAILDPRDQFKQEYPITPEEAFISSGRPLFNTEEIRKRIANAPKAKRFTYRGGSFVEDERGELFVFKKPENRAYAIGADVAEGLEEGDSSTACVMDKDMEACAVYCGKIDPDQFGVYLVRLAKWYNGALLTPEVNNHGHATVAAIKRESYYSVFKREVQEELGRELQDKIGWQTNSKTKMLMLDELVASFRDNLLKVNCASTLREMITINIEDGGDVVLNGKDRTVALGLAIQGLKQAVVPNSNKAYVPGKIAKKDVTKMSLQEKLAYYKRGGK